MEEAPKVLTLPTEPVLSAALPTPSFDAVYAGLCTATEGKLPSNYLLDSKWVASIRSSIKGVNFDDVEIDSEFCDRADKLLSALEMRFQFHVAGKVDKSRWNHFTLAFVKNNLPPMAAAMCLAGHIVEDIDAYGFEECLLKFPSGGVYEAMSDSLGTMEGCYLFFDMVKSFLIFSGK